ncbi:sec-independent protein translocase protein TatA [Actinopolymorpha cephalotaxi]|uniref:Sec-independent protein translocase protein TatA n=1 Tax=Actinopolymorpha cephalotaxi TaxID=504797 RepID=A0A1I2T6H8_9ACTN|nr:Sec-independent protein translocase subunit TatA [Actinopolymorpha cephalotaxi]NYH82902.1 sec-independent protein translocase protein TatA [Actinopolymorpha cephalotaxi]SFG58817.1 sec-independent protein translocase protein TatA [Actinopolymorpha cephalotaxi]
MGSLGPTELIIIGVVLVLLFGATRLPQTAKGLGQALKIFKSEVRDDDKPQEVAAPPQQQQPVYHQPNTTNGAQQPYQQPVQPPYQQPVQQPVEDPQHTNTTNR